MRILYSFGEDIDIMWKKLQNVVYWVTQYIPIVAFELVNINVR